MTIVNVEQAFAGQPMMANAIRGKLRAMIREPVITDNDKRWTTLMASNMAHASFWQRQQSKHSNTYIEGRERERERERWSVNAIEQTAQ